MHVSSKKLALTSVAYAVTLAAVAAFASSQFETIPPAKAEEVVNTTEQEDNNIPVITSRMRTQAEVFASYRNSKQALAPGQLSELLYAVGFRGQQHKTAWGIVMRESNARPLAHNGNARTGDSSYGIFQVNMFGDLGPSRKEKFGLTSNTQLFDPVLNAQVAFFMSKGGEDFGAWGIGPNAYRSGAGMTTLKRLGEYPGIVKVIIE
jgi:hypothetical protein